MAEKPREMDVNSYSVDVERAQGDQVNSNHKPTAFLFWGTLSRTLSRWQTFRPSHWFKWGESERRYRGLALQDGFPRTAAWIAADPNKTSAIYKRFEALSARNLLHLQGRLAALEAHQIRFDLEDRGKQDLDTISASKSWEDYAVLYPKERPQEVPEFVYDEWEIDYKWRRLVLEEGGIDVGNPRNTEEKAQRWELAKAIQNSLKEYQEALVLHSKVLQLEQPANRTFEDVKYWYRGHNKDKEKDEDEAIQEVDYHDEMHQHQGQFSSTSSMGKLFDKKGDWVSLHRPADKDRVSDFLSRKFKRFFTMKESTPKGPNDAVTGSEILEYISDKKIAKIVTFLGVVASFILFIPAVWGIEKIESLNGKLGALTGFVILFSLVVIMLSKAERIEVISATALYAAVLIVLVGKG